MRVTGIGGYRPPCLYCSGTVQVQATIYRIPVLASKSFLIYSVFQVSIDTMSPLQIAILIQIIGFLQASVSIAFLQIDGVKKSADNLKSRIIRMAQESDKHAPLLDDSIISSIFKAIFSAKFKRPKGRTIWKHIAFSLKIIFSFYLYLGLLDLFFQIERMYLKTGEWIVKRISAAGMITRISIICGTMLVFIGLILEFLFVESE
jgi:hypothetical protein